MNETEGSLLPTIPITYFGAVLGIGGLGNGWRAAHRIWGVTPLVGEALSLAAFAVWALCAVLFARGWLRDPARVMAEFRDPVRSGFAALLPVSTMIASLALWPHLPVVALTMVVTAMAAQVVLAAIATAGLWRGGREPEAVTPIVLMPTIGGAFVCTIAAGQMGAPQVGLLFFGAGVISWIVTEPVVLRRLVTEALPPPLRATLGIYLTPPALACVAYLAVTDGPPDRFAQMLFGYALLQGAVMLRLIPWLREQAFSHRAWAYTFGVSAIPLAALRLLELGQTGPVAVLALPLFAGANLVIGWIALRSARLGWGAVTERPVS